MENIEERRIEEKIYSHTYDSLVRELAKAMEVDQTKIYPVAEAEFDHEDIQSWIGAVKFTSDKAPNIEANLSTEQGQKSLQFDTQDQKVVGALDEKATKEELIYSMALTEAKMKVISEIASDTYPAVTYQIDDYRKEMEKVRDEILGNQKEKVSLEEILGGVINRKSMAAGLIIGGMILSACGGVPVHAGTETKPYFPTEPVKTMVTEEAIPTELSQQATLVKELVDSMQTSAAQTSEASKVTTTPEMTSTQESTATPEATATPEVPLIDEHELNPKYTMEIDQEYMGVQIKASLIVDKTFNEVSKVTMPDQLYADLIAREFFDVYWGSLVNPGMDTEEDFKEFMKNWATAQKSGGNPADWEKVQFTILANKLDDGNGYKPEKVTFWPMYDGETPEGVQAMDKFSFAFVGPSGIENVKIVNNWSEAWGTNLDVSSKTLYLYNVSPRMRFDRGWLAPQLTYINWWMLNSGRNYSPESEAFHSNDVSSVNRLLNGGFQVYN